MKLKEVIFSVTSRCNLKCRMCDIPLEPALELSTEELKIAIKDASQLGVQTIVFSGGEPLVRKDICELAVYAKAQGLDVCLTSNGALISDALASELARARIKVVNVSLEGPEHIHDSLRGKGSFRQALLALDNLHKYAMESTVAATVSRYNYAFLPYIIEAAHEHKATTVRFQPFNALFIKDKDRGKDFFIDRQERRPLEEAIEVAIVLARKYCISINPEAYLRRIPAYLSQENIAPGHACSALWTSCPVNAQGDVYLCWALNGEDKKIGNIKDRDLVDLWDSSRHEHLRKEVIKKGCAGCLMSCYDEVFGDARVKFTGFVLLTMPLADFFKKAARKVRHAVRRKVMYLSSRCRFYAAYRGSMRQLGVRLWNKIRRPAADCSSRLRDKVARSPAGASASCSGDTQEIRDQIEAAQQKLKNAISVYE